MTDFHRLAGAALSAVSVSNGYELSWFGEVVDEIRPLPDEGMMREATASFIGRLLYRGFYLFGWPQRDLSAFRESMLEGSPSTRSARFINAAVYTARHIASSTVRRPLEKFYGEPAIELDGAKVQIALPQPQDRSRPDWIEVQIPGISLTRSPGFVLFRSPHGQPGSDGQRLVRLYWNVTAVGALELITLLTRELDGRGMRYQFKVVHSDTDWPERADTGVLYIGHRDLLSAWTGLGEVHDRLLPRMRPYIPALTCRIGLGLGLAEDPGNGDSYGMFVCDTLADGLMRAHADGSVDLERRLMHVTDVFTRKGRSLGRPYAGEEVARTVVDPLLGIDFSLTSRRATPPTSTVRPKAPTDDMLIEHADRLAQRIAHDALWHSGRCNWLKPRPDSQGRDGWVPMAADLYGGTAGIALFFAYLAAATGDRSYTDLAAAASRQALATATSLSGVGLYSGMSGVGLTAALVGHVVGEPALLADGFELVSRSAKRALEADGPMPFDVVDGLAGALIALVGAHALGSPDSIELAGPMGTLLMSLSVTDRSGGLYWLDSARGDTMGFIGFAHGASGCALALAELGHAICDPTFLEAAERACQYERSWYDEVAGNWRDVRSIQERGAVENPILGPDVHRYDWCYGAPGIALSRTGLLLDSDRVSTEVADDAHIGFTKAKSAGESFPRLVHDVCVCHGAAGIAEILSFAPEDPAVSDHPRTARTLTHHALLSHHDDLTWPGGYGLMLGAAGVGMAALRRVDPTIVSPLLLLPHRYSQTKPGEHGIRVLPPRR
ncbi:lanthionine synthetase LanC family protein [Planomonospora sp. ID82291]|uniref:lanthionine synthetase LanC family protein n=1 Tax=Planomonospora sp. ID82291 TaxID=2738136 RepID=UPI0018C443D3|nr:lanthionine synthetase LanC family protein [Planomonospora sp. ID82291]MBG0812787.1 hypothetical protein [Planomonospora sp. ID82291]